MVEEIWKTAIVDGETWENYQVSNFGRILSLNYNRTGRAELMELFYNRQGYLQVQLSKNGKRKTFRVNRLVAETFLENPDNLLEVNHKDEDKTNNFVFLNEDGTVNKEKSNLEWKSHKDNCNHGTRNERVAKTNSKVQKNDPNKSKRVLQFTLSGEFIREWPSARECGRNGFDYSNVAACCRGEKPYYKGFRWEYA